jgi:hypothetical protein
MPITDMGICVVATHIPIEGIEGRGIEFSLGTLYLSIPVETLSRKLYTSGYNQAESQDC